MNISWISGKVEMVGQTNYSAAKAGIVGLTKAAAKVVVHLGIRVNALQPGLIRSAMTEAMQQKAWDQKVTEIPMGRAGGPEEVAKVVLFYASDLASYMTGTVTEVISKAADVSVGQGALDWEPHRVVEEVVVAPGPLLALQALLDDGLPTSPWGRPLPPLWHWVALSRWPTSRVLGGSRTATAAAADGTP